MKSHTIIGVEETFGVFVIEPIIGTPSFCSGGHKSYKEAQRIIIKYLKDDKQRNFTNRKYTILPIYANKTI